VVSHFFAFLNLLVVDVILDVVDLSSFDVINLRAIRDAKKLGWEGG